MGAANKKKKKKKKKQKKMSQINGQTMYLLSFFITNLDFSCGYRSPLTFTCNLSHRLSQKTLSQK
jgi:hypothetical protein